MAPNKALPVVSGIKAAFTKAKSNQSTCPASEMGVGVTSLPQTESQAESRASRYFIRAENRASKDADARVTDPFPNFAQEAQLEAFEETAVPPRASPPRSTTTKAPTSARPSEIISHHASLLLACGPQRVIVNLPSELSKTGKFISPLPINPAAAPLSRGHFKCPVKHACLQESSNVYAPTLCTTCHGQGDAVLACCRCCHLRICKRCADLLAKAGNDLERMLNQLVTLGVWRGLEGQG